MLELLDRLNSTIEELTAVVEREARKRPEAKRLMTHPGVGSLEPGKDADIAVWDRDPYTAPTDELKDMKCELTLLRGEIVYDSGNTK